MRLSQFVEMWTERHGEIASRQGWALRATWSDKGLDPEVFVYVARPNGGAFTLMDNDSLDDIKHQASMGSETCRLALAMLTMGELTK